MLHHFLPEAIIRIVAFFAVGHPEDHIDEFNAARFVRQDRRELRIPLGKFFALSDLLPLLHENHRTRRHWIIIRLGPGFIRQANHTVTIQGNELTVQLRDVEVDESNRATDTCLDFWRLHLGDTTNVERTHG